VILYFAGNVVGYDRRIYDFGVRSKLLTFAEIDDWGKQAFDFWITNRPEGARIFMDSGAFSAFMRGAVIDIDRYMNFIKTFEHNIETYVQLDKIGDPEQTAINLGIMESNGLTPIPVFTGSAPIRDLHKLCEKYDHIALGGLRGKEAGTTEWRRTHFDRVFSVVKNYWPKKLHAFGITSQWALERYPFYSADSSSAIVGAGMGRVMTFEKGILDSEPWVDFARRSYEGAIVDGVGDTGSTKTTSAHMGRRRYNVDTMLKFERHINDVWRMRGWDWKTDI
jgi:hypothetical protein